MTPPGSIALDIPHHELDIPQRQARKGVGARASTIAAVANKGRRIFISLSRISYFQMQFKAGGIPSPLTMPMREFIGSEMCQIAGRSFHEKADPCQEVFY